MCATQLISHGQGGTCSNCGAPLEPDAFFCIVCGKPVSKTDAEATPSSPDAGGAVCVQCGSPLEPNAQFCVVCGAKVTSAVEQEEDSIGGQPQEQNCPNCGWPLESDAIYCISCGFKVGDSSSKTSQPYHFDDLGAVPPVPAGSSSGLSASLVPAPPMVDDDDDATVRPRLVMLTREEARTGCRKTIEVDRSTHESIQIDVPAGVDVTTKLDVPGYGYFDELSGQRGPMRLTFFIG